jgi:hypothetical protein
MLPKLLRWSAALMLVASQASCQRLTDAVTKSWHEKCSWRAEDYFDDPKVVALCKAIEANDLNEIDRLVAAGADVNAQGKGKMTPLLWAFPDNKLQRFKRLLEHGADPNVVVESEFNTRSVVMPGDSVTHMATRSFHPGYFEAVFAHGGDPNLKCTSALGMGDTPLFSVIISAGGNKKEKIRFLLNKGADIDYMNQTWATPVMQATSWGGQYNIALMLLEAGADYRVYVPKSNARLVHQVIGEERRLPYCSPQQRADYQRLCKWLEDHGESFDEARSDIARWASWNTASGEYRRKMDAEVARRKAREAREKKAAAEGAASP